MSVLPARSWRPVVVLALVGGLWLTGCSSDDNGAPAPTGQPTTSNSAPSAAPTAPSPSESATSSKPSSSSSGSAASSASASPSSAETTVPPGTQKTNPPTKKLTKAKSTVAPKLTAELTSLKTQYVKSRYPGELSGNAVVLGLRITNSTSKTVDLGNVVVNVEQANGNPASQITSPPAQALPSTVKPGARASGVFVFTVPKDQRNPITVSVTLSADTTVAVFKGKA